MSTGYFNIFNSLIDDIQSGNAPFNEVKFIVIFYT